MENWREFQKRNLDKKLRSNAAKRKHAIATALSDLTYIEEQLLPNMNTDAQFRIAQKALMDAQVRVLRLQLEDIQDD